MPLRVLSIATLFPSEQRPGFGQFVARQFDELVEREDIDLTVICPVARQEASGQTRSYPVHYVKFGALPLVGSPWNPISIKRSILSLVHRMHAEQPFDLVDAQFFFPDGPAAARIATELGLPLSIKARGSDIHLWGRKGYARKMMLAAAEQAGGILAVSAALREDMARLGIDRGKINVHYTGLDHSRFHPRDRAQAREKFHFSMSCDQPLIVSLGNLIPLKGHDIAMDAMATIIGARLIIVGNGPEQARLNRRRSSLWLAGKVWITALPQEEVAVLLAAADVMVLASAEEGLANAWIEALASGTPIVITDVGGAREVVTSPAAGRIVERNPDAIARALNEILSDPPSQAEVAAHAARFSWEANAAQLAEHYRRVAGAGPPSRVIRS
ncbi:MAG: glycosyltransferase [Novosphingobium sp.]